MFQDNLVTMRNGRYCIPVKAEYKNHFPGMIHDQSSTGATVFIEPMAIVNLNNELKELDNQELAEIEKILESLSSQTAAEIEYIKYDFDTLAELDFIFARASFARSYKGTEPIFNTDGIVDIKQGRHPLLEKHTVVPVDIKLGEDYNLLIVTGPNTGGKTVSLKTLGLFSLMGQSGLHIPALDGSRLNVFDDVFADIGDEQSIEQNLSTFSSHMSNIVYILDHVTPGSLVLFDELGGGTDPIEGAALAIAILSHLNNMGVRCMATTHYSELKTFAMSTPGVENASCEFDVATLQPTYKLMIGIPGKSNAFAIAKKLGIDDSIIESAKANAARMGDAVAAKSCFFCADAGQAATRLAAEGLHPDVVMLDPPRKGCAPEVFAAIDKMGIERLVYVSCDPATLARDLALLATMGYTARRACGVDLFPRTPHVETVVLVEKNG